MRLGLWLAVACGAAVGCAGGGGGTTDQATAERPPRVRVQNDHVLDVEVSAVRGGAVIRLGLVTAKSEAVLELPRILQDYSDDIRFLVDPVGSRSAFLSDPVRLTPGDLVELDVALVLDQSSVWIR